MKRAYTLAVLITLFFLVLYGSTASRHAAGYADSDEFLTAAWLNGVAHPPGYALLISILSLIVRGVSAAQVAPISNLLASCLMASALGLLYLTVYKVLLMVRDRLSAQLISVIALVATMLLGVSGLFWLYAGVLEVVSLSVFLSASTMYLAISWYQTYVYGGSWRGYYFATWFFTSLLVMHIQTGVLFLPGLLLLLVAGLRQSSLVRSRFLYVGPIGLLLGLALSLGLLWRLNSMQAAVSWSFDPTITGLVDHVLRRDYEGLYVEESVVRDAYAAPITVNYLTVQDDYIGLLMTHLGIMYVLLFLLGLIVLVRHAKTLWLASILTWALLGCFLLAGRLGIPSQDPQALDRLARLGIVERQYMLGMSIMPMVVAVGMFALVHYALKYMEERYVLATLVVVGMTILGRNAYANFGMGYTGGRSLPIAYVQSMLDTVAEDSVIICGGDVSCFGLAYASEVLGIRPDVTVLTKNNLYRSDFLDAHPAYYGLLYTENPNFYAALVTWNLSQRRVYLSNPTDYYIDYIGLDGKPFFLVPRGYLFEVVREKPNDFASNSRALTNQALITPLPEQDHFMLGFRDYLASIHLTSGNLYALYGEKVLAQDELAYALTLKPDYQRALDMLTNLDYYAGSDTYADTEPYSVERLLALGDDQIARGNPEEAYDWYRKATYWDPTALEPRIQLAAVLEASGYVFEASWEVEHGLLFAPENEEVRQYYERLKQVFDEEDMRMYRLTRADAH